MIFPNILLNEGMHYTKGVFLIFEPGYYQVTLNLLSWTGSVEADIMVNNAHGYGYGKSATGGTLHMSPIVKLEKFDSVSIRMRSGTTSQFYDANYFQIQKIALHPVYRDFKLATLDF